MHQSLQRLDVVIDDDEGAALGMQLADQHDDLVAQERVHTGERFVEKQDLRIQHQRAPKFQQLLLPARQVLRLQLLQRRQTQEFEMLPCRSRRTGLGGMRPRQTWHQHVLQHRHAAEQLGDLEGAPDAQCGEFAGCQAVRAFGADEYVAGSRGEVAGQQVDGGGLAGAVRADQADKFVVAYCEVEIVDGDDAAEPLGQVARFDDWWGCGHG